MKGRQDGVGHVTLVIVTAIVGIQTPKENIDIKILIANIEMILTANKRERYAQSPVRMSGYAQSNPFPNPFHALLVQVATICMPDLHLRRVKRSFQSLASVSADPCCLIELRLSTIEDLRRRLAKYRGTIVVLVRR